MSSKKPRKSGNPHPHPKQAELSVSDQQKLSVKYQNIFDKQVLADYENENYRDCIKQCDRILQQYPKNGETLAMKGLCLHCEGHSKLNRYSGGDDEEQDDVAAHQHHDAKDEEEESEGLQLKEDGLQLISLGLSHNLKSSICWRVKGLAHKNDHDFEAAMTCYKQALKYDKQNQRILTDLANLQIQCQKFSEFVVSRRDLWLLNQDKLHCVAYIVALYLNQQYQECQQTMQENMENAANKFKLNADPVELNEMHFLQIRIYLKLKQYDQCLAFLVDKLEKKEIVDVLNALQMKLKVEMHLDRLEDAKQTALLLIEKNPENLHFHQRYQKLLEMTKCDTLNQIYAELAQKYPRCNTIQRILLECYDVSKDSERQQFEQLLHTYLQKKFKKSVVSLYNDVKNLYAVSAQKGAIMDALITKYRNELATNYRFCAEQEKYSASPMCLLWVNYFYCSRLIDVGRFEQALQIIDETLSKVPTGIDLYLLKGKLFKYAGNKVLAFKYLNMARKLDQADRYLNTKCVRYAFNALYVDEADRIIQLFLKKTEGTLALHNLQVIWYELHKAMALLKLNKIGPALKQFENIYHHFEEFWKNQTDFHRYAYRKCAIYSYLQLLDWEYKLRDHAVYIEAAKYASNLWFRVHRLQQSKQREALEYGSSPLIITKSNKKKVQRDEYGWKLIHSKQPLNEAYKWLKFLIATTDAEQEHTDNEQDVQVSVLYIKYLLYTKSYSAATQKISALSKEDASDAYAVYNICSVLYEEEHDKDEQHVMQLKQKYSVEFLKQYYQENTHDFDKITCILRLCLNISEIADNIGVSIEDMVESIMKTQCSPLQCAQIREIIAEHADAKQTLLALCDKHVANKYPLQLKVEDDIL